ncbi:olfactory receptor 5V1-like [Elgaria multicarinata webbii]|uniref:olfactory receptor 5V1-like n=1 Tax=Elgaria multicarinata webbii TaxID=159646 RepID=UPI002FCCF10F
MAEGSGTVPISTALEELKKLILDSTATLSKKMDVNEKNAAARMGVLADKVAQNDRDIKKLDVERRTSSFQGDPDLNASISQQEEKESSHRKPNSAFPTGARNWTQLREFVFLGFSGILHGQTYLSFVYVAIYLVTVTGNIVIFALIQLDSRLHSPMYFFLCHLSCLDICLSSVTVPKILVNLLSQQHTITYNQCMAQMFFLMSFTGTEAALLAVMAYDRYAAICKPLYYSRLMNTKVCIRLATAAWLWGFLDSAVHTALNSNLYFCRDNQIPHIFCDVLPLLNIACGDTHVNTMAAHIASIFVGLSPFLVIVLSYIYILSSILRIRSNTGRQKAFSTCASHMFVVTIYFGNGLVNYNRPRSGYSLGTDTLVSTMYCIVPPMLNPLIYTLRNKEVMGALRKALQSQKKPSRRRPWQM